jgi:hypothetical protein
VVFNKWLLPDWQKLRLRFHFDKSQSQVLAINMEITKLILEFVKSLLWPVAVVIVAVIYRKEVRSAFGRLSKADLPGGLKLGFDYHKEKLSEEKSIEKAVSDKKKIAEDLSVKPSAFIRYGELPIDLNHSDEHAYAVETLALNRLEHIIYQKVERYVLLKKGDLSDIFDGIVKGNEQTPDRVITVLWTRTVDVKSLISGLPGYFQQVKNYKKITGREALLSIVLVVPQRVIEAIEHLKPLTQELADTDCRVYIVDYDDIGFSIGVHAKS